ncbi:hypothetical protein H5410_018955 [Solanum commersonii]|uniref:Reverse transcriptase zinc-binding domain-containing protein n=1 Tax=Solanum commersonii TaxID=4109 RepID=A0A9J6A4A1_SOLCO|nr:hypothetical protein H5410_018955 [Solanum commersonii]
MELIDHIISCIKPPNGVDEQDRPCWMLNTKRDFLGSPSFMMWKFKIPVDDKIRRWGMEGPSRCWCCERPDQETLSHSFTEFYNLGIMEKKKHEGKNISYTCNIMRNMYMLIKCRRPGMRCSGNWPEMIMEVEDYNPRVKVTREFPPNGWVKYNTDGTSRGNPGIMSSYAFDLSEE